jgi:hypothetical protein
MLPAIQSFRRLFGGAPTWVAAGLPSLNRIAHRELVRGHRVIVSDEGDEWDVRKGIG